MTDSSRRRWRAELTAGPLDGDERAQRLAPVAARAADGDLEALDDLLWAIDELDLVRRTIRRLLVDDRDAEEAEQDVLVAVAEAIPSFRGDARFTTWLHQIARHKAIALLRRHREVDPLPDDLGDAARISSMIATRTTSTEPSVPYLTSTAQPWSCATSSTGPTRRWRSSSKST